MNKKNIEQQKESDSPDYLGMLEKEVFSQHDAHYQNSDKSQNNEHSSLLKTLYRSVDLSMQQYAQTQNDISHLIENTGKEGKSYIQPTSFTQVHELLETMHTEHKHSNEKFESWKKNHPVLFMRWFMVRFIGAISLLVPCIGIPGFLSFNFLNMIYNSLPTHSGLQFICILLTVACMFGSIIGGGALSVNLIEKIDTHTPKISFLNKISLWLRPERSQEDIVNQKIDKLKEYIKSLITSDFQQKSLEFFAHFRLDINDPYTIEYDAAYQNLQRAFASQNLDEAMTHYQSLLSYLNSSDDNKRQQINMFIENMNNSINGGNEKINIHSVAKNELHQML